MLLRLGTLLLIVPLLLPPGVCVCELFAPACAECAASMAAVVAEAPESGCHCCHHRDETRSTSERTEGHTCAKHAPDDQGGRHVPGCPAKPEGGQWKVLTASAPLLFGPGLFLSFVAPESAHVLARPCQCGHDCHVADQPLYLTHLTLLI